MYYYNNKRIHSILKMTPVEKRKRMTVQKIGYLTVYFGHFTPLTIAFGNTTSLQPIITNLQGLSQPDFKLYYPLGATQQPEFTEALAHDLQGLGTVSIHDLILPYSGADIIYDGKTGQLEVGNKHTQSHRIDLSIGQWNSIPIGSTE